MAAGITKDVGRQSSVFAYIPFTYVTLGLDVVSAAIENTIPLFDVPPNAILVSGRIVTTTAFVAAGDETVVMDIGDGGSAARYVTNADVEAAGVDLLVATGFKYAEWDTIDVVVTSTTADPSAFSAGAGHVMIEYIVVDRVTENV